MVFEEELKNIYRLKVPFEDLYTSVFLIKECGNNILVDCATTADDVNGYIIPAIEEIGLTIKDINFLVITHPHSDHAGGKTRLLELCPTLKVIDKQCSLCEGVKVIPMAGHTTDFVGLLVGKTLISGDGLQGAGVGKYRCSLENKVEYLKTIEKIRNDERIKNILFSHAYEPWYKDGVFGREEIEKCLEDCKKYSK